MLSILTIHSILCCIHKIYRSILYSRCFWSWIRENECHQKSNEIRFWFTSKVNQPFPDDFFPFRSIHTSIFFIWSIKLFNKSLVHSISKKFLFWMHWIWADYKSRECPVIFTCSWVPFFTKKGMTRSTMYGTFKVRPKRIFWRIIFIRKAPFTCQKRFVIISMFLHKHWRIMIVAC